MSPGRIAIAATTFACMTLLSIGGPTSAQAENAQAQAKHSQASKHTSAKHTSAKHVATAPQRRHGQRVVRRGYGPNPVEAGANVAAGAVNTAGAVAAGAIGTAGAIAAAPFGGTYAAAPGWDSGYYGTSTWGDFDCRPGYGDCRPYASKDWAKTPVK